MQMYQRASSGERRTRRHETTDRRVDMPDGDGHRELLERERVRLLGLKENLTEATEDEEHESPGDPSAGGHIADAGSELFERSRDLSIVEDLDAQLADIEHATARLTNGSYGTCEACGRPIDPERLDARPATRFCLEDQQGAEREVQVR
jgi:RNA polymerase-binding transcription factor DksA